MKYIILVPVLLLSVLLTACSAVNSAPNQSVAAPATMGSLFGDNSTGDTGNLEDFINAVNNHQLNDAVGLFSEDALVTIVNEASLGPNLASNGLGFTFNGKVQIENWLKEALDADLQIAPLSYAIAGKITTLEAFFYYPSQQIKARLDTSSEKGRFKVFYYYIENIMPLYSDSNP